MVVLCESCGKSAGEDEALSTLLIEGKGIFICADCIADKNETSEMLEDIAPDETLDLIDVIVRLNRDFNLRPHKSAHYRNRGEKGRVDAELRLFNGNPQLIFFYGKRRYTFDIEPRKAPSTYPALKRIVGYKGIAEIRGALVPYFKKEDLDNRHNVLKQRGV